MESFLNLYMLITMLNLTFIQNIKGLYLTDVGQFSFDQIYFKD